MKKDKKLPKEEAVSNVDRHTTTWLKRLGLVGKVVTALLYDLSYQSKFGISPSRNYHSICERGNILLQILYLRILQQTQD